MNKLIELLNKYEEEIHQLGDTPPYEWNKLRIQYRWNKVQVISKEYGFIRDLVKADRIDLLKLTCMNPQYTEILDSDFSWEDRIIMILSIQNDPIVFLISILK